MARRFASQGAIVFGTDISKEQIELAKSLAKKEQLIIDFQVAAAETSLFPNQTFDVITANQCWLYFDKTKVIPEVKRILKSSGQLLVSSYHWLPKENDIAGASEQLILNFNPHWHMQGFDGNIPGFPAWAENHFKLKTLIQYREDINFTAESWRGRIRASRPIGVDLTPLQINEFDQLHRQLLSKIAPKEIFSIPHLIWAYILEPTSP